MGSAMDRRPCRYLYAEANPTTLIDPSGHAGCPSNGSKCIVGNKIVVSKPDGTVTTLSPGATGGGGGTAGGSRTPAATVIFIPIPTESPRPIPGPAPCGGPSPDPCQTATATYPGRGSEVDVAQAALTVCSVLAPPPAQIGCDAEQFREAVANGDPIEMIANGIGFIFYIGDGAKWVIKGGKALFSTSEIDDAIRLLKSDSPARLSPNRMEQAEIAQANDILRLRGGHYEGNDVPFKAGIDGTLDGVPVSLKRVGTDRPISVLRSITEAERKAAIAGFSGVDVYVDAQRIAGRQMSDFAQSGPIAFVPGRGPDRNFHPSQRWLGHCVAKLMSIDFEARIVEPLELAALWSATKRNFLALTGSRSDSLDLQVAVDTLEGGTLAGPSNPERDDRGTEHRRLRRGSIGPPMSRTFGS